MRRAGRSLNRTRRIPTVGWLTRKPVWTSPQRGERRSRASPRIFSIVARSITFPQVSTLSGSSLARGEDMAAVGSETGRIGWDTGWLRFAAVGFRLGERAPGKISLTPAFRRT